MHARLRRDARGPSSAVDAAAEVPVEIPSLAVFAAMVAAMGCVVEASPHPIGPADPEEAQRSDPLVTEPGRAIWTKIYRPVDAEQAFVVGGVASDRAGDTFVARSRLDLSTTPPTPRSDLTRYGPTGILELRRAVAIGRRITALAVGGGLVATIENDRSGAAVALAAYDSATFAPLWRKGGGDADGLRAVAVDDDGRVIVVGRQGRGAAVVRYRRDGVRACSQRFVSTRDDETSTVEAIDVAVDRDGEIYLTGSFTNDVALGGGIVLRNAEPWSDPGPLGPRIDDGFVVKLSTCATPRWTRHLSGVAEQLPEKIAVSAAGRVALAGHYRAEVVYPDARLTPINVDPHWVTKAFVSKLDREGRHVWSETFDGSVGARITIARVLLDGRGRVGFVGTLRATFQHDGRNYTTGDELRAHVFAGIFGATTGYTFWLRLYGDGDSFLRAGGAAFTPSGRLVVGGDLHGSVDLGGRVITHDLGTLRNGAGFLARLHE
jgi:hypothetical protein